MAILWNTGDRITAKLLNDMQLQYSSTAINDGDTTTLSEGSASLDTNGNLYQSVNGKQSLIGKFKGADDKDGSTGNPGKDGTDGVPGKDGKDGLKVTSGVINEDKNGIVTGITLTMSDNTTVDLTVNKAS